MKISLLHPSRNRAATADATVAEWLGKSSGRHPIEYIISIDRSDGQIAAYRQLAGRHGVRLIIHPNRNSVQACNHAARVSTGDLLVMVSDDFGCPEDWDDALVRAIGERRDVAVFVNDGFGARTMTLPIIDRAFYHRFGYLLFPGYIHLYCDDDLEEVSRRRGKLIDARHLVFPHRHYMNGAAPYDPTYHHAGRSWGRDALLFQQRRVRDFDLRPPTLGDFAKCGWLRVRYDLSRPQAIVRSVVRRVKAGLPPRATIRAILPAWARRWREYSSLLPAFRRKLRFRRYERIPEATGQPLNAAPADREACARKLAVVVPFRESQHPATLSQGEGRAAQLTQFVDYMTQFLAGTDHHIFVIEQSEDGLPFNKGYLMNVGFHLAGRDFDYFAFHDVDQLPTNPRNTYAYPPTPEHLCVTTDGRTQYRSMVGGVLLINRDDFVACNGWSNRYLGWGQEDDDMANRLRHTVGVRRVPEDIGTYRSIRHPREQGLDETYQFQKNRAYLRQCEQALNRHDGYRDATFTVQAKVRMAANCTRWTVAVPGPSRLLGFHCYVKSALGKGDVSLHEHVVVRSPIVSLRDSVLDRTQVKLRTGGGAMPSQPIPEEQEFAIFAKGALRVGDLGGLDPTRLPGYQQRLLSRAEAGPSLRFDCEEPVTTFVVERREYVNLYHTLIELFNAYVAIQLLAREEPFHLLLLDGHCQGSLDTLWSDILKPARVLRLHEYPGDAIQFKRLVLVPGGYDSPLYNTGRLAPTRFNDFLSDFIEVVLRAYRAEAPKESARVLTFIDRRDYRPHPRSDGLTCRKVDDLDSTVSLLQRLYPQHRVDVHGFEHLSFGEQLRIVRQSEVLCGVHGAALAHVLFMRPHSELVEFRPREYRRNDIFENLAGVRGVRYRRYFARTKQVLPGGKLVVAPTAKPVG